LAQSRWWLLAAMALCCAGAARAQFVDASAAGQPVKLDGLWRFHEGDNLAWAAPSFDDSSWQLQPADKHMPQPGNGADPGWGWYRIRAKLPATKEPLALAMGDAGCEVYVDGSRVGDVFLFDPRHPRRWRFPDNVNVVLLPPELNGRTVTIAVREAYYYLLPRWLPVPSVAPARLQWQLREADSNQGLVQLGPQLFTDILMLCLGLFSLGLFLLHRRSTEYGWAALYYLVGTFLAVSSMYFSHHHANLSYVESLTSALLAVTMFAAAMLIWKFIGARPGGLFRAAMVLIAIMLVIFELNDNYVSGDLLGNRSVGMLIGVVTTGVLVQAVTILFLVRMGISAVQGNRDAQLLCIPFTLSSSVWALYNVTGILSWASVMKQWTYAALEVGQATVRWMDIFDWLAVASMGAVLVLRFVRSSRREQRLSSEMETARKVQAQLVPAELPATEHFRFEAVYRSAGEVGGDLYQVYSRPEGSVMVLVGDVSGKGLKAAMLGTLVVGAAGAFEQDEPTPAAMLSRLNRRLCESSDGGFVTCLCCVIAPDGRLTLSNAGHLAPYRNGQEVPCSSGLPLGLIAGAEYAETELQLGENDTLTFLSDGVVEARNAHGELFGFDRAQAISAEPARKIAEQAVAFGQEDDITVLRLTFAPAGVPA
jgi:hypothetical protein